MASQPPGGTQSSGGSVGTFASGSQFWILTSGAAARTLGADPVALHYFARPGKVVMWPIKTGISAPASWHTVPWLSYTSFAQFQAAVASGTVPPNTRAVMYDCENWDFTPANEQADPVGYMRKFAALAHAHGYMVIGALGIDVMDVIAPSNNKWTAFEQSGIAAKIAPLVDFYHIQSQRLEQTLPQYVAFTQAIEQQVRAANPKAIITAGVTTNMNGAAATPQQIASAVEATSSIVSGYWLNVPSNNAYDPSGGAFNPAVASAALALLP
ncbi:MAG: hypothetical protein M3R35_04365 [Candidatus Eremiobacteraeota bacterium]|nr:hypothetical protein [Candidatus Eremiobacteraeota bacterium]